jgi:hypothetical protein
VGGTGVGGPGVPVTTITTGVGGSPGVPVTTTTTGVAVSCGGPGVLVTSTRTVDGGRGVAVSSTTTCAVAVEVAGTTAAGFGLLKSNTSRTISNKAATAAAAHTQGGGLRLLLTFTWVGLSFIVIPSPFKHPADSGAP